MPGDWSRQLSVSVELETVTGCTSKIDVIRHEKLPRKRGFRGSFTRFYHFCYSSKSEFSLFTMEGEGKTGQKSTTN